MRFTPTLLGACTLATLAGAPAARAQRPAPAAAKRAITFADFAALKTVSDPQLSPDGQRLLYAVRTTDVAQNRRTTATFLVPAAGGTPRAFPDDTTPASEARWSPDGRRIAFVARGQLWVADADGGGRRQLTALSGGASGPKWSPRGDLLAFASAVYPECRDDACNKASDSAKAASKVKARVADRLMYRHWNAYDEGTRSHLFVVSPNDGAPRDLVPGAAYDVPPAPFGGSEAYDWAPDGRELAFTAKDQGREEAWSTDLTVYTVPAAGGAPPQPVTAANRGADQNPAYSPDGRYLAYASQARAGFESDRWRLMLHDRRTRVARELLPAWDRSADAFVWAPDSRALIVQTGDLGRDKLYRVPVDGRGAAAGAPRVLASEHNNMAPSVSANGRALAWTQDAADHPAHVLVAALRADGTVARTTRVTRENDALLAQLDLRPAEDFWFRGADGDSVHGFVVKPPMFDPARKYPTVLLVHGGPQGAWLDNWGSRWNYAMFAAPGNAVVFINPRGSTTYGQRFTDQVSKDWGGRAYQDLMLGVDAAVARHPWLDSTRMGAAGASYGGYMTNWIAGHTDRFKALVTHAGVFNLEHMYGATEELWFPEWEFGGPYWDPKAMGEQYRKFSPHLFAQNFRTPTLVTHGELDYRVPYTEGLSLFTVLQRQNVPSRLVLFPDEGHWILKPQNQQLWYTEVQGWLRKYLADVKPAT